MGSYASKLGVSQEISVCLGIHCLAFADLLVSVS